MLIRRAANDDHESTIHDLMYAKAMSSARTSTCAKICLHIFCTDASEYRAKPVNEENQRFSECALRNMCGGSTAKHARWEHCVACTAEALRSCATVTPPSQIRPNGHPSCALHMMLFPKFIHFTEKRQNKC